MMIADGNRREIQKFGAGQWNMIIFCRRASIGILVAAIFLSSCLSPSSLVFGIQPGYEGVNPSRILAVTPFVIAVPAERNAILDPAILKTSDVIPALENEILQAFSNQPAVNGVSFRAVRESLERQDADAIDALAASVAKALNIMKKGDKVVRERLSEGCVRRQSFVDFYFSCLKRADGWISSLNELAIHVLNADTALLAFVTSLHEDSSKRTAEMTLNMLLVDTNNGDLLWAGQNAVSVPFDPSEESRARWKTVVVQVVEESLWSGFPGRISPESVRKEVEIGTGDDGSQTVSGD